MSEWRGLASYGIYDGGEVEAVAGNSRINLYGLSDPIDRPTGFARVARELFAQLPESQFDLCYGAGGWFGSHEWPHIRTFAENRPFDTTRFGQEMIPQTADRAFRGEPYLLWTLSDPWHVGWIGAPDTTIGRKTANETATRWLSRNRKRFRWVGHFPVDAVSWLNNGIHDFDLEVMRATDRLVLMSEWAADLFEKQTLRRPDVIPHAVADDLRAIDKDAARRALEQSFAEDLWRRAVALQGRELTKDEKAELAAKLVHAGFDLQNRFVVVCVMHNRERKYWPVAIRAFAELCRRAPKARPFLIALCGDIIGRFEDSWPLDAAFRSKGLRLAGEAIDPNVWLVDRVVDTREDPQASMRVLYSAADVTMMPSGGEGFGLPQLEAHACGRGCIVGAYSASTELAVDTRELVHPIGDVPRGRAMISRPFYHWSDFADKLEWAYKSPQWRAEVAALGVEQAKRHSWQVLLPRWIRLFAEEFDLLTRARVHAAPQIMEPQGAGDEAEPTGG